MTTTDDHDHDNSAYLARVSRDLRADAHPRDESHVTPVAIIPVGRRELDVAVASSGRFGTTTRIVLRAPMPLNPPGAIRREQEAHLYVEELDALIAALTAARAQLVAAPPRPPAAPGLRLGGNRR